MKKIVIGVTILASTIEIKIMLYFQCTGGEPVWIDKASMHIRITLVFLTALYMHLISPTVDSEARPG